MSGDTKPPAAPISGGQARYALGVLFVVYIFNFMDRQILSALLVPIQNELGATDRQMGLLTGLAFALFYTTAGIPIARLADKRSRTMIIAVGLTVWSVLTAASGLAKSFIHLAVARVGVGVGEATATPSAHSLISDYYPPEKRAGAIAIYSIGGNIGAMLGPWIGGAVAHQYGWRAAFFVVGIPGLFLALLVRLTVREPPRGYSEAGQETGAGPGEQTTGEVFRYMFSLPSFRHLCLAASLYAMTGFGVMAWLSAFMMRSHGLTVSEAGKVLGLVFGLGSVIGAFIGGFAADKLSRKDVRWSMRFPAIGAVAMVPLLVCFLLSSDTVIAIAFFAPAAIIGSFYAPPSFSTVQGLAQVRMRALASAVFLFFLNLVGLGLGPFVVGLLSDLLKPSVGDESLRYAMLIISVVPLWAATHFWLASRSLPHDLTRAKAGR